VSGWRRCDTCRKVRSTDEYDGGAPTCRDCLTGPAPRRRASSPVTTTRAARPATPKQPSGPQQPAVRAPLLGSVGSGDLEVRERRARRKALEQLAESHPQEFALLLRNARAAEGLRAMASESAAAAGQDAAGASEPEDSEPGGSAAEVSRAEGTPVEPGLTGPGEAVASSAADEQPS
jgi:hypothetical protein